jgi:NAD+ synthetase
MKEINFEETVKNIRLILKNYIIKSDLKSLVIGVSGGIDSALVCALAKPVVDELGIPLIGRSLSIQTNKPDEEERARNIGSLFCTDFKEVDLSDNFIAMKTIDDMEGVSENDFNYKIRMGNIKARIRMIYLYNLASKYNGLVLSTDNESELMCGFWTLNGDVGDYAPIQHLWKTEVYAMTEYLSMLGTTEERNALMSCVECNATDGLGITSSDLDQLLPDWKNRHKNTRTGYKEVDGIFINYFNLVEKLNNTTNAIDKANITELINIMNESPVIQRYFKTEFKRNHPTIIDREKFVIYR